MCNRTFKEREIYQEETLWWLDCWRKVRAKHAISKGIFLSAIYLFPHSLETQFLKRNVFSHVLNEIKIKHLSSVQMMHEEFNFARARNYQKSAGKLRESAKGWTLLTSFTNFSTGRNLMTPRKRTCGVFDASSTLNKTSICIMHQKCSKFN